MGQPVSNYNGRRNHHCRRIVGRHGSGRSGYRTSVIEGRQILGGRAYSFMDSHTGDSVDNGQHLFMGCYRETQDFLERIGALDKLKFQTNLAVDFIGERDRHAKTALLAAPVSMAPLSGLLRLSTLSWADDFDFVTSIRRSASGADPQALEKMTVEQWLKKAIQSERARRHLWDLIAIATLNENPAIASAAPFAAGYAGLLRSAEGLATGSGSVGLSELYVEDAVAFCGERARRADEISRGAVRDNNNRVEAVELRSESV